MGGVEARNISISQGLVEDSNLVDQADEEARIVVRASVANEERVVDLANVAKVRAFIARLAGAIEPHLERRAVVGQHGMVPAGLGDLKEGVFVDLGVRHGGNASLEIGTAGLQNGETTGHAVTVADETSFATEPTGLLEPDTGGELVAEEVVLELGNSEAGLAVELGSHTTDACGIRDLALVGEAGHAVLRSVEGVGIVEVEVGDEITLVERNSNLGKVHGRVLVQGEGLVRLEGTLVKANLVEQATEVGVARDGVAGLANVNGVVVANESTDVAVSTKADLLNAVDVHLEHTRRGRAAFVSHDDVLPDIAGGRDVHKLRGLLVKCGTNSATKGVTVVGGHAVETDLETALLGPAVADETLGTSPVAHALVPHADGELLAPVVVLQTWNLQGGGAIEVGGPVGACDAGVVLDLARAHLGREKVGGRIGVVVVVERVTRDEARVQVFRHHGRVDLGGRVVEQVLHLVVVKRLVVDADLVDGTDEELVANSRCGGARHRNGANVEREVGLGQRAGVDRGHGCLLNAIEVHAKVRAVISHGG